MKSIIKIFIGIVALSLTVMSCNESDTITFGDENYIYFDKYTPGTTDRIDTVKYSFSYFPTEDKIVHHFKVSLIGHYLTEDKEYKIEVLDGEDEDGVPYTTALSDHYEITETPIFRKDRVSDTLTVTLFKDKVKEGEEYYLTLRLVANENFGLGYYDYKDVKIRYNNADEKPLWWNAEITATIFGEYSKEKLHTIMLANPGFVSTEGMGLTEMRKIALKTKDYIAENNIKEADGTDMTMPIY